METRKGFKAYDHGLICRGKQYKEGEIFEEAEAVICEKGMHYCDNPADIMFYHDLVDKNGNVMEVTEVEDLSPKTAEQKDDGYAVKYCTTKLNIGARLSFKNWLNAAISVVMERCAGGDSGYSAQLASSGYSAQLASSGYSAQLASSGDSAQLASSGNYARLASSGNYARLASSGDDSVIAAIGVDGRAKGAQGNWLTLAEWTYDKSKDRWIPICVKTEYVDGERIKADTWYMLEGGEFKEAD